jgi:hypothetical protein
MSLSSAKNYALRAARSQDEKEAIELLSKAILELAASIEDTDSKVKQINKSKGWPMIPSPAGSDSSFPGGAIAPGVGRITGDFRFGEFALWTFENMFLRAVGVRRAARQLHSCSTHGAARRLDRLERQRCGIVGRRHGLSSEERCPL